MAEILALSEQTTALHPGEGFAAYEHVQVHDLR